MVRGDAYDNTAEAASIAVRAYPRFEHYAHTDLFPPTLYPTCPALRLCSLWVFFFANRLRLSAISLNIPRPCHAS